MRAIFVVQHRHNNNSNLTNSAASNSTTSSASPRHVPTPSNAASPSSRSQTFSSSQPSATPARRPPLQPRDCNAVVRMRAPLTLKSRDFTYDSTMPPASTDKIPVRPLMPSLSSATRPQKAPLTPRVAATANPRLSTPVTRKPQTPVPLALGGQSTPLSASSSKEDLSTPVSTFLSNNNITPRSGKRLSRIESNSSTPTGLQSPNDSLVSPIAENWRNSQDSGGYGLGGGMAGLERDAPKKLAVTFSPTVSDMGYSTNSANTTADSQFFFARDIKPSQSKPAAQSKNSTFFYASGEAIASPPASGNTSASASTIEEKSQPKFFHANGSPDLLASPSPSFPPSKSNSSSSNNSRMAPPRLANPEANSQSPRSLSPQRLSQNQPLSLKNSPQLVPTSVPRPQASGRGQSTPNVALGRRISSGSTQIYHSHGRSLSVNSGITTPPGKRISDVGSVESELPSTPLSMTAPVLEPNSIAEEETLPTAEEEDIKSLEAIALGLQSPVKAGHSIEHMNELAANARRERKVLDLEITNSSLAAINRTLEREMRKQAAELRRFRRLSRSGRISIATAASTRTSEGSIDMMGGFDGTGLSDMSEGAESEEEEEDFDDESSDETSLSPAAIAESDARHRKQDEKHLQLDLAKHRQLLIDSQRINQSLKHCLGWTEELITEGKKALAYNVKVSDIELGGRILLRDEGEGEIEGRPVAKQLVAGTWKYVGGSDDHDLSHEGEEAPESSYFEAEPSEHDTLESGEHLTL